MLKQKQLLPDQYIREVVRYWKFLVLNSRRKTKQASTISNSCLIVGPTRHTCMYPPPSKRSLQQHHHQTSLHLNQPSFFFFFPFFFVFCTNLSNASTNTHSQKSVKRRSTSKSVFSMFTEPTRGSAQRFFIYCTFPVKVSPPILLSQLIGTISFPSPN